MGDNSGAYQLINNPRETPNGPEKEKYIITKLIILVALKQAINVNFIAPCCFMSFINNEKYLLSLVCLL